MEIVQPTKLETELADRRVVAHQAHHGCGCGSVVVVTPPTKLELEKPYVRHVGGEQETLRRGVRGEVDPLQVKRGRLEREGGVGAHGLAVT